MRFDNTIYVPTSIGAITNKWFTDKVEERTQGRIKFLHLYAGALTKAGEEITAVQTGLADFSMVSVVYYPTQLYLNSGFSRIVPFNVYDLPTSTDVIYKVFYDYPYLSDEVAKLGMKLIYANCAESYCLESTKPVTKIADMKGMKIAVLGSQGKWFLAAGAVPLSIPIGDRAVALQTGVIEGDSIPFDVGFPFRLYEFAKYQTQTRFGATLGGIIVMNQAKFNKLSPEDQRIIVETGKEAFKYYKVVWENWRAGAVDTIKKAGVTINPAFSDEEVVKWANMVGEPVADWVKDGKNMGLPQAADLVKTYINLCKETGYKYPKEWKIE